MKKKEMCLHLETGEFKKILEEVSRKTGYPAEILEKDYYQTLLLYEFAQKQEAGLKAYLEGGTAAYKSMHRADRVSEDIDILVDTAEYDEVEIRKILRQLAKGFVCLPLDEDSGEEHPDNVEAVYRYESIVSNDTDEHHLKKIELEATAVSEALPTASIMAEPMIYTFSDEKQRLELLKKYHINPFKLNVLSLEAIFYAKLHSAAVMFEKIEEPLCAVKAAKHIFDLSLFVQEPQMKLLLEIPQKCREILLLFDFMKQAEGSELAAEGFRNMQDRYVLREEDKTDYASSIDKLRKYMENGSRKSIL